MNIIKKYWVVIVLLISSLAIITALTAEYMFNILPCKICLYQRYPYYILIIISFIYIILKTLPLTWYYWICSLFFSIGLFFSVWHVGIEQKILPGLPGCTFTINASQSLKDLKEQILKQNIATCDEVTWSFIGLYEEKRKEGLLILLLLVNIIFLVKHKYEKEKQT